MTIILPRNCPWSFHLNGCARILFCLSTVEDLIDLTTIMTIKIMIIILAISHKCNVHMSMVNQWTANVSSCTLTAKTQSQVNDDNQSTFLLNRRRTRSRAQELELKAFPLELPFNLPGLPASNHYCQLVRSPQT